MLKWRPTMIPLYEVELNPEQRTRLAGAQSSPAAEHLVVFQAMVGLMILAKEIKITQPGTIRLFTFYHS